MTRSENAFSRQSTLSGGTFESNNMNGIGDSQTEQSSVEDKECEEATEQGNTVDKSFINVENISMEGIERGMSGKQTEQSGISGRDTHKELSCSEVKDSNSQTSGTLELFTSSSKTMTAELHNPEECASNTSQMYSSETLLREDVSSQHQDKIDNFGKPLGLSEPKRRRVDYDNINTLGETQGEDDKHASTPNRDQLTGTTTESEAITIEVRI